MTIILLLDYIGTCVFAISGALAGMRHRFDPFGVLILAAVTAVGGGSLRDVLIGRTPVGWMQDINYAYLIITGALIAILFRKYLIYVRRTMFLFDAIGLGLFTIIGVEIGVAAGLHPVICILLGTLSASFGGVIRDILSNEVPLIFHKEVYASLSILGGITYLLLQKTALPSNWAYVLTSTMVVVLRVLAVRYNWIIPKLYKDSQ
ncbi:trimeric intracellular cation channel family protein [Lewinella cohaerens]|uniref:trimeric intracellular cation channel family protein n=1 Tax=Lewinella cohaerens TaxID=70995 RepID=UPI00036BE23A|nr:trimeric intracellular cation channel family protein [Lewinella cohaerens]